jgi:hypothetical protein
MARDRYNAPTGAWSTIGVLPRWHRLVLRKWGDGRTFPRVRVFGGARLIVLAKGIRLDGPSVRPIDTTLFRSVDSRHRDLHLLRLER